MKKYWAMKTFPEWWATFQRESIIGIDEEGVDVDYSSLTQKGVDQLLTARNNKFGEYQNRVFQQFSRWMQVDDYAIIGTGQTTTFNISGIVRVAGHYQFKKASEPRHIRRVEILKVFSQPRPMLRFMSAQRLELIDEADFHESIVSLLQDMPNMQRQSTSAGRMRWVGRAQMLVHDGTK